MHDWFPLVLKVLAYQEEFQKIYGLQATSRLSCLLKSCRSFKLDTILERQLAASSDAELFKSLIKMCMCESVPVLSLVKFITVLHMS